VSKNAKFFEAMEANDSDEDEEAAFMQIFLTQSAVTAQVLASAVASAAAVCVVQNTGLAQIVEMRMTSSQVRHMRSRHFFETVYPHWKEHDPSEFFKSFRMYPDTFQGVLDRIRTHEVFESANALGINQQLGVEHQLVVAMAKLASGSTFRAWGNQWGVSTSSAWRALRRVVRALIHICGGEIKWPFAESEKCAIAKQFEKQRDIPNICGIVDGTYIEIRRPKVKMPNAYWCRKNYWAITAMGVCDDKLWFIYIRAGAPGSRGDARNYKRSNLVYEEDLYFYSGDYHILGDSGYPLTERCLIPFTDHPNMGRAQRHYNWCHSSVRILIEKVFAYCKGRWRILEYIESREVQWCADVFHACCILHNICVNNDDVRLYAKVAPTTTPATGQDVANARSIFGVNAAAQAKRSRIMTDICIKHNYW